MKQVFSSLVIVAAVSVFAALFALNLSQWHYYADTLAGIAYHYALPAAQAAGAIAQGLE